MHAVLENKADEEVGLSGAQVADLGGCNSPPRSERDARLTPTAAGLLACVRPAC